MKNLYKYLFLSGLMALCSFGTVIATDMAIHDDKTLLVGCRPWDANVQQVKDIKSAHCLDFMDYDAPDTLPNTFHHLDLNDEATTSASKFSVFASANPGRFHTIIIDWMTYHHIRRDTAWADFATLLSKGGTLIIPVTRQNMAGESISKIRAQEIVETNLTNLFSNINTYSYEEMPTNVCVNLLRRTDGITKCALTMKPQIIFASK